MVMQIELEDERTRAARYVRESEQRVAQQHRHIAALIRDGRDTTEDIRLLKTLEKTLVGLRSYQQALGNNMLWRAATVAVLRDNKG